MLSQGRAAQRAGKIYIYTRKVEKQPPFLFMHPTWAVNEAFNRKVGQVPFEIVQTSPLRSVCFPELGGRGDQYGFRDPAPNMHTISGSSQGGVLGPMAPCTKSALLWGKARSEEASDRSCGVGENQRYSSWGLSQLAGLSLHPPNLQVDPCFMHSFGNWAPHGCRDCDGKEPA